jgi:hypothetical protein
VVEKCHYLAPYQKTSEMIDQLFESILGEHTKRPSNVVNVDKFQQLYTNVKSILCEQQSIFMVATVLARLEEKRVKHTHKEVLDVLHILEDVGKLRKMGEVQVGDTSHNLYLYGDS